MRSEAESQDVAPLSCRPFRRRGLHHVEVPDVEFALAKAESLGGTRTMGPGQVPGGAEIGLRDWAAGLLAFPLLAAGAGTAVAAPYRRETARARPIGWGGAVAMIVVVLGSATAFTYLTPIDGTGVWIFLAASMLLAAAKGYGGCEVLAFANAVNGRQDSIGCVLYAPIDKTEAMLGKRTRSARRGRSCANPRDPADCH